MVVTQFQGLAALAPLILGKGGGFPTLLTRVRLWLVADRVDGFLFFPFRRVGPREREVQRSRARGSWCMLL